SYARFTREFSFPARGSMSSQRRFILFLLAYTAILAVWYAKIGPQTQKQPTQTEIAQKRQQAQEQAAKAEQEARTGDNRLSISDRARKWDEAIRAFEQVERQNPNSDAAIDAKIQIARIHEERAASDARNTGDYDVAERLYKDLERQ